MLEKITNYFIRNSAVKKVADDPAIAVELLLLTRVLFIDRECSPREVEAFARIAKEKFDIDRESLSDVVTYLKDFGYETSTGQAALIFEQLAPEYKMELIQALMEIAVADNVVEQSEVQEIERIAAIIGITPDEIDELFLMVNEASSE